MLPWLGLAMVVILLDQASKIAISRVFEFGQRMPIADGFFDLTLLYNKGAAFSFLAAAGGWQKYFFIALGTGAALFIVWLLSRHNQQRLFSFALAMILGGAIGNVIDRLAYGHVVDFILVYWRDWYWPAFNLADSAIVCGAGTLMLDELLRVRRTK
ncbi:signal peptidase II [Derxia gummosa]|uniref:Lipoprotein signal peptidase n=1 Tax=Derxia gummosa DSM 723 TaxID=1121388 RepID=A0A8B6X913_9BURK|nr:signal peptidase II [Derxia gummosa]